MFISKAQKLNTFDKTTITDMTMTTISYIISTEIDNKPISFAIKKDILATKTFIQREPSDLIGTLMS